MDPRVENGSKAAPAGAPGSGWDAFERDLAAALRLLRDECLILAAREGNRFVQFCGDPEQGLFAETVSNAFLPPGERLEEGQERALRELGWTLPTHAPDAPSPV